MKQTIKNLIYSLFAMICFMGGAALVFGGEPSSEPMLRLGTEMHFATVRRISSDASGRYILTCSDDKTARLWDGETGNLVRIFRVPAEAGNEGKLYACALSPDGRIAAVGGWTKAGYDGLGNHNIYLFNTSTGEMIQRLPGMENVFYDIEFYSNHLFAAALGGANGIRVFKKTGAEFSLYKKDADYGDDSYNIAFDSRGRLASVCSDGYIRLYDSDFNPIKRVKTTGGKDPYSLAFSLDNTRLAVGYDDTGTVEVLNADTLGLVHRPDNTGADTRDQRIYSLTFGPGGYLYGGGFYAKFVEGGQWHFIRRWSDQGRGRYLDFKAAGSTVMDIKTFGDGSIIMAGYQPDMARFTSTGERIFYKKGEVSDFKNYQFKYLTVSRDAGKISFKPLGSEALTFSIADRELTTASKEFDPFQDSRGNLKVTDWEDSYTPKINGRQVDFLDQYEICRSVDIGEDDTIVAGTEWSVYALDKKGNQKWRADVSGVTWAVNIAQNNKIAVAAHHGGEIRWYRMSDGAVLLSLFVHPDGKRWILSTPDGYYDASPGADTLMGWHVNNGRDRAASFYPMSKFRSAFYRPDVVANVIKYHDTKMALQMADKDQGNSHAALSVRQMLPPTVTILFPEDNAVVSSDTVRVRYRVTAPSGEKITSVKVLMDGRPLENQQGIQRGIERTKTGKTAEITVPVPPRDVTLSIVAENRFSASEPATVRLKWKGPEKFIIQPKLYVLAMGSSRYEDTSLYLAYPAKDARDIAAVLKKQRGGIYRDVAVKLLADPSRDDVMDGLEWIERQTTDLDVAAVFLAGHGVNDRNGKYYYLPVDANPDSLKRTAVSYAALKDTITGLPGKVLFFLDTCHSGNVMGGRRGSRGDLNQIANDLSSAENGIVVFTSSSGTQYSLEDDAWGNGAFTKALVEGLSGKADYHKDNKISISELTLYVAERVKELTRGRQTPTTSKPDTIADFPVVLKQ